MNQEPVRHVIDTVAAVGVVSAWVSDLQGYLTLIVTAMAGLWYGIQIYGAWKKRKK